MGIGVSIGEVGKYGGGYRGQITRKRNGSGRGTQ